MHGAATPRQIYREAVTAGRSWRRQPRVGCAGGVLSMVYGLHGAKGLSEGLHTQTGLLV